VREHQRPIQAIEEVGNDLVLLAEPVEHRRE
jgi:hypothetical protein